MRGDGGGRAALRAAAACQALVLALGASAGAARAAGAPEGVSLYLRDRLRWEHWQFLDPGDPGGDPDYDFVANQLRWGVRYEHPRLGLHAAGQYVQLVSLPEDASGTPGGALGTGALYFAHSGERHPEAVQLKYLNAEFRRLLGRDLALALGRMSYASGAELDSGVPKIEVVKASRIADRLVGEFGWSHFQRSFDGARLRWEGELGGLSAAWLRPTEGGFEDGGTRRIDAIDMALAAATARPGALLPGAELQLFYALYDDERDVAARVDATGLTAPDQDHRIHTLGGHLVGAWPLGAGELDLLAWAALQRGEWFEQDHRAAAGALELGYQLAEAPGAPWLRAGAFRSTGDRDPGDGEHGTFFPMLPTARRYAMIPAYTSMNLTDLFAEIRLRPSDALGLRLALRDLRLSSSDDLLYAGSGATQHQGTIFGYSGRASGGHRHVGNVLETSLRYRAGESVSLELFYGRLWGASVLERTFREDDDLDFLFLELRFHWGWSPGAPAP